MTDGPEGDERAASELLATAAHELRSPRAGVQGSAAGEPEGTVGTVLTVDDAGPGVAPEHRSRVFERLWRGERGGGSGLGPYLVAGLVATHGGTVEVTRSPAGGARLVVPLPSGVTPTAQRPG